MENELPHSDEEIELRKLLQQAMSGPDLPLTAAQTGRILASLPAKSVPQDWPLRELLPAATCLALATLGALSGTVPEQVRGLVTVVMVGNLALSPFAAAALVWRRRFHHAT